MLLRTCATDGGQKSLLKTRQLLPRLLLCSDWVSVYCVVTEESAFQTLASGKRNGLFDNLCPLIAALINLFSVLKNCRRFMFLSRRPLNAQQLSSVQRACDPLARFQRAFRLRVEILYTLYGLLCDPFLLLFCLFFFFKQKRKKKETEIENAYKLQNPAH